MIVLPAPKWGQQMWRPREVLLSQNMQWPEEVGPGRGIRWGMGLSGDRGSSSTAAGLGKVCKPAPHSEELQCWMETPGKSLTQSCPLEWACFLLVLVLMRQLLGMSVHWCLILCLSAFLLQAVCSLCSHFPCSGEWKGRGGRKKTFLSSILPLISDFISGHNIYSLNHHNSSHYLL